METNYKISIPKPCHENWDQMTPDETGRFCNSCAKSVVDFTNMKAREIQDYFIQNQGQKVCGRFKNEQLDTIIIEIPQNVLFSQAQFHKMFMLALLICMGTTLFSCQSDNGRKKIDGVEIVKDSVEVKAIMGLPLPPKTTKCDTISANSHQRESKKGKVEVAKAGTITGDVVTSGIVSVEPHNTTNTPIPKDEILHVAAVEIKPNFPGGIAKFYAYFTSNFKISEENKKVTGRIIVSFVVDTDGNLHDIKILRGINESLDKEALKVLEASPKWIPGEHQGQKVKVAYSLPIKITAQE